MCNYDGKINLVVRSSNNSMRNRIFLGRKLLLNLKHLEELLGMNQIDCQSQLFVEKIQVLALVAYQTDVSLSICKFKIARLHCGLASIWSFELKSPCKILAYLQKDSPLFSCLNYYYTTINTLVGL